MTDMLSNLTGPTVPSLMCCVCVFECEHCLGLFFFLSLCLYEKIRACVCCQQEGVVCGREIRGMGECESKHG